MRNFRLRFPVWRWPSLQEIAIVGSVGFCIAFIGILLFLKFGGKASANWYDDSWFYRTAINFGNTGSADTYKKVKVEVDTASLITAGKMKSDCSDSRFTDINGNPLAFYQGYNLGSTANLRHESNNFSEYTSSTTDSGDLSTSVGSALGGSSYGLSMLIDDTTNIYATKNLTLSGNSFRFRYYIDPNTLTMASGNAFYNTGIYVGGTAYIYTDISYSAGNYAVRAYIRNDAGTSSQTSTYTISDAPHYVEIEVNKASTNVSSNATLELYVDGVLQETISGIDFYDQYALIDSSRWGVTSSLDAGTSGTFYMDEIAISDNGSTIGPVPDACNSASTDYYVLVSSILSGSNSIFHYYGNQNPAANTVAMQFNQDTFSPTSGPTLATEEQSPGPAVIWNFDEGTGTTAYDGTNNGTNGTLTSGPVWKNESECISGKCLYFDGSDDHVTVSTPNSVKSTTRTISFWIKPHNFDSTQGVVSLGGSNYYAGVGTSGRIIESHQNSSNAQVTTASPNNSLTLDQWQHVALVTVTSGTAVSTSYYVNGIFLETDTLTSGHGTVYNSTLRAARVTSASANLFEGYIDEIKIYPYARTANQIKQDFVSRGSINGIAAQFADPDLGTKLSQSLITYFKFDETTSPSRDSIGVGTTGTWSGNVAATTGKFANAAIFDGSGDYITSGTSSAIDPGTEDISISTWIKPTTLTGDQTGIIKYENGNTYYILEHMDNDTLRVEFRDGTCTAQVFTTTDTLSTGVWTHVAATFDRDQEGVIYINGKKSLSSSAITSCQSSMTGGIFTIGRHVADFDGIIDEGRIYNRVLTSGEVQALYNFAPSPFAYWKLDDNTGGDGATIVDSSGNANSGTILAGSASNSNISVYDTFTESSNTALSSHLPDVGIGWTSVYDTATGFLQATAATDILESSVGSEVGTGELYAALPNPSEVNQSVSITLSAFPTDTNTRPFYIFARRTDNNNMYAVRILSTAHTTASLMLYKVVAGVDTALGVGGTGVDITWSANDVVKLEITDSAKKVYVNGVEKISDSDNSLTSAGTWGVGIGNVGWIGGNISNSWDIDNFTAEITSNPGTDTGVKWVPGKYGSAFSFDGSNDYIATSTNNSLKGLGQFTIGTWFKTHNLNSTEQNIYVEPRSSDGSVRVQLAIANDNKLYFGIRAPDSGGTITLIDDTRSLTANTWYHVAAVFDSVSDVHTLYLNGVGVTSNVATVGLDNTAPSSAPRIGSQIGSGYFNGAIDDFKIYNYVRSSSHIIEDMNANHPVGGSPIGSQSGYWKFDEGYGTTAYDSSSYSNNMTLGTGGSAPSWSSSGKYHKALNFDGTDDFISITDPANGSLDMGLDGFTISTWINTSDTSLTKTVVDKKNGTAVTAGYNYRITTAGRIQANIANGTTNQNCTSSANNRLDTGAWRHIIFTVERGAANDIAYIYIDGQLDTQCSLTAGYDISGSTNFLIGKQSNNTNYFIGLIDEVKVYRATMTSSQVATEYNRGKAVVFGSTSTASDGLTSDNSASREYCVPGDTTSCSAPVAEWKFDENTGTSSTNDTAGSYTGTFSGIAATDWVPGKQGSAINFNGTSAYVTLSTESSAFSTNSYTYSGWFKRITDSGAAEIIFDNRDGANDGQLIQINSSDLLECYYNSTTSVSTTSITPNNWYFFTCTANGATQTLWINGIQEDSDAISGSIAETTNARMGARAFTSATSYFPGVMDQIRFYNYVRTSGQIAWDYNRGAPLVHYKLDDCQGTTGYNSALNGSGAALGMNGTITASSNGNTAVGTCTSATSTHMWSNGATGKINSSLNFDGSDDFVSTSYDSRLSFGANQDFTVAAWVKSSQVAQLNLWPHVVSRDDNNASRTGFNLATANSNATPEWYFQIYVANTLYNNTGRSNIRDGTWHHLVGMRKGATLETYEDGVFVRSVAASTAALDRSIPLRLGGNSAGASPDYWSVYGGSIDDVRIYNYALTPILVKTVYNNGAASFK